MKQFISFLFLIVVLTMTSLTSVEASEYPSGIVKIISGFPPGSTGDTIARIIAEKLPEFIGQPVIVENKPGAAGSIAAMVIVKEKPDGYQLLMGSNSVFAATATKKNPPFDPISDFTPIARIGNYSPPVLVVSATVPDGADGPWREIKTVQDLVRIVRGSSKGTFYASGNMTGFIAGEQFKGLAKLNTTRVPYKGEPAALVDLIAGRVQWMFAFPTSAAGYIKNEKLRVLATTGKNRNSAFPDVPSMSEFRDIGMSDWVEIGTMVALLGPKGMPEDVVNVLSKAVSATLEDKTTKEKLRRAAFEPMTATSEELPSLVRKQVGDVKRIVEAHHIPKED